MATTRERIVDWLAQHPGQHRPTEVAAALDLSTQDAAWALTALQKQGRVTRHRTSPTSSTYSGAIVVAAP